jgi:uncharacterized membrane protein (DUF4010 family)
LVNSTATIAELSSRLRETTLAPRTATTTLSHLTTMAMFARNLILATIFCPASLSATLVPLLAMTLVAGLWIWLDQPHEQPMTGALSLSSPVAVGKVLRFGFFFIVIQIGGALLTRIFGNSGMLAVAIFGGLVSSASTTAAAATMAMHGQISPSLAGSATVLASLASAAINLPIIWRTTRDRPTFGRLVLQTAAVVGAGILAVAVDRVYQLSELLIHK